jgi:hypothetical protein
MAAPDMADSLTVSLSHKLESKFYFGWNLDGTIAIELKRLVVSTRKETI